MSDTESRSGTFIRYAIGDDVPLQWELEERDGEALAAGQFSARAQVRRGGPGGAVLHEWSTENERAQFASTPGTDGGPDRWWLQLLVDDSRDWAWERGEFDVFIADPQGRNERIDRGVWINDFPITDRIPAEGTP